ncbi:hypothetical protein SCHPADRAFT_830838 [Schizopora paradoxa]|uniref:Mediator of RNA polymerase II transcription subunit 4 n=1 Tax=Schizopora paradoxa TaxID=27342 RepID=A0A0H2S3T4_9AGAM|nr:hypothetical protein SCHPADRAFT_830838 [Schizopora paradoxa]
MSAQILEPLDTLGSLSHQLFLALSPPHTKPPPPPPLESFLTVDAHLAVTLQKARIHQRNQRKIEALKTEILALETNLRDVWLEMEKGKRELEEIIEEGETRIRAMDKAKEVALPYPELLQYAQSLSAFTSAPPNMPDMSQPGVPPPPLFFPPFPNEEKMRRGHLNAEAPLGPLGETHTVGEGKISHFATPTASSDKPEAMAALPANPYRPDQHPRQEIFDLDLDLNPDF